MENSVPVSSVPSTIGQRNVNTAVSGNPNFAAVAAAAIASQDYFLNAVMRAAAASAAPVNVGGGGEPGSGASNSPLSVQLDYAPETAEAKLIDYRHEKVAAFDIDGETMMCLPQAYDLFLRSMVGGLHTVYTKLKRLEISPYVCNVEQVRALRSIGAIQPGVNRCKLISCRDFDSLYEDCASSSSRPGRPPKRSHEAPLPLSSVASSGSSIAANNGYMVGGAMGANFGVGTGTVPSDGTNLSKRPRMNDPVGAPTLDKFTAAFNPMASFVNTATAGGNVLNSSPLFPLFPFGSQSLMFSHIMNANPNANMLAKQFGAFSTSSDGTDNATPIDATARKDSGNANEACDGECGESVTVNRTERAVSFASNSGQESNDFPKFLNGAVTSGPSEGANFVSVGSDRHRSEESEGSNSGFGEGTHSPAEDAEDKDESDRPWIADASTTPANAGTEASQLLRSMVDMGVGNQLFAAAAAAAVSQQGNRPRGVPGLQMGESSQSKVESILFSVLGLVQVAASTARLQEEQLVKDKLEAIKMYEMEKRERSRLDQLVRVERHAKAVYLKRLRRERKQKAELTEKMLLLAEELRKQQQNTTSTANSTACVSESVLNAASVAYNSSRSTSSCETASPFFPPKAPNVSWAEMMDARHYQGRMVRDSEQDRNKPKHAGSSPVQLGISGGVSAVESMEIRKGAQVDDPAEIDQRSQTERGRTATLFVKNELS